MEKKRNFTLDVLRDDAMIELVFPEGATKEEREINWQKIAEISDADLGFNDPRDDDTARVRFCVRILLVNDKREVCVIKSEKHGYLQIPGGGIEQNESIEEALSRETEEETGYLIKNIAPLGYLIENRQDKRNEYSWGKVISFVFAANVAGLGQLNYTEGEALEEFHPYWINLDELISIYKQNEGKKEGYTGTFANRRDLIVAKYYNRDKFLKTSV